MLFYSILLQFCSFLITVASSNGLGHYHVASQSNKQGFQQEWRLSDGSVKGRVLQLHLKMPVQFLSGVKVTSAYINIFPVFVPILRGHCVFSSTFNI